ncbi:MAG: DUF4434 domain-containing protein [Ginsengibacter sp.]
MKKAKILISLVLICNCLFAQKARTHDHVKIEGEPLVGLTLIPPSPVTDQILLDIRAGIHNDENFPIKVNITFYIDEEKKGNILYDKTVTIDKQAAKAVKFRWPTKNKAGDHKIILVCKLSKKVIRTERSIQIIASNVRSTRRIDGAWINFYHWSDEEGKHWNPDIKKMTDDQWRELIDAQHELDMNIVVMQELFRNQMYVDSQKIEQNGYKGLAFYPSDLFPGRMPIAAHDPVEAVLSQADINGMNVFVGVGLYAWFDFSKGSLEWHKKVASELWKKYGHHPSFYGWYISEEMDGGLGDSKHRKEIVDFFHDFSTYVHQFTPEKPIMLATNCHNVRTAENTYSELLKYLDILCPFGFQRMPKNDYTGEEVANVLQKLCDAASSHLWMDMEAFEFEKGAPGTLDALIPRPINGLLSDLHRFPNFEKILCYQFPGLMNSPQMSIKPGGENTVKLFLDYKKYLDEWNLSNNKTKK